MKTLTLSIPGINCGHCVHTIETELGDLEGVQKVEASSDLKQATITFENPATEEQIKTLLTEINYPAAA